MGSSAVERAGSGLHTASPWLRPMPPWSRRRPSPPSRTAPGSPCNAATAPGTRAKSSGKAASNFGVKIKFIWKSTPQQHGPRRVFPRLPAGVRLAARLCQLPGSRGGHIRGIRDCNRNRLHSALKYVPPDEFHASWEAKHKCGINVCVKPCKKRSPNMGPRSPVLYVRARPSISWTLRMVPGTDIRVHGLYRGDPARRAHGTAWRRNVARMVSALAERPEIPLALGILCATGEEDGAALWRRQFRAWQYTRSGGLRATVLERSAGRTLMCAARRLSLR